MGNPDFLHSHRNRYNANVRFLSALCLGWSGHLYAVDVEAAVSRRKIEGSIHAFDTAFSDVSLRVLMLPSALEPGQKLSPRRLLRSGYPYNHVAKAVAFLVNMGYLIRPAVVPAALCFPDAGRSATVGTVLRATEGDIPMIECEDENGHVPSISSAACAMFWRRLVEAFYASVDLVIISELTAGARPVGPVFVELRLRASGECADCALSLHAKGICGTCGAFSGGRLHRVFNTKFRVFLWLMGAAGQFTRGPLGFSCRGFCRGFWGIGSILPLLA